MITHIGGMISFLATEMHFDYLEAVYIGDTITCTVTFDEKDEEKRLFRASATSVNQDGVEVLRACWYIFSNPSGTRIHLWKKGNEMDSNFSVPPGAQSSTAGLPLE